MKKISLSLWFLPVVLSLFLQPNAIAWTGKVIGVADGDTIKVMKGSENVRIRLYGVDTPESKQAYGNKAKKATNALVRGQRVDVTTITTDRQGCTPALIDVRVMDPDLDPSIAERRLLLPGIILAECVSLDWLHSC